MTDSTNHISANDLAVISGKVTAPKASNGRDVGFLTDLGLLLAHLAFFPLAYLTFFAEVREDLFGVYTTSFQELMLYAAMIAIGYVMFATKSAMSSGREFPLARHGVVFTYVVICILTPVMLGFAVMTVVTFSVGGFAVIGLLWKGIAFFGLVYVYFAKT
jgi:hypothetical protein